MKHTIFLVILLNTLTAIGCGAGARSVNQAADLDLLSNNRQTTSPEPVATERLWQAAEFKSLKVGRDSREDALKALGKPISSGPAPNEGGLDKADPEIWDTFEGVDKMYARVTVMSSRKTGKISMIEAHLSKISLDDVLKRFGKDFQRKEYGFVLCVENDPKSAMLVEMPGKGESIFFEYPEQGIAVATQGGNEAISVEYRANPLVPRQRGCGDVRK